MSLLVEHSSCLTPEQRRQVLRNNVIELFNLSVH
jgi:hypothetical protein